MSFAVWENWINDLILNIALTPLYIHKVGSKRITSMSITAVIDNVIEISSKIYNVKK